MKNNTIEIPTTTDFFSSDYLINNVGTPFIIGFAVGYFAKKILLLSLLVCGAAIVLLFVSEHFEVTHINYQKLEHTVEPATQWITQFKDFLLAHLSNFPSKGISATSGFLVGFKLG
jgi:uncharacterized membrane protein (Fun14 family)